MRIEEIREHMEKWQAADLAVSRSKSYTIDGLVYTRQDAQAIRDQINYWAQRLAAVLRGGCGVRRQAARVIEYGGRPL